MRKTTDNGFTAVFLGTKPTNLQKNWVEIDDDGVLRVFQDDSVNEIRASFALNEIPMSSITESKMGTKSTSFWIGIQMQRGKISFAFKTEQQRAEMMKVMRQYLSTRPLGTGLHSILHSEICR